MVERQNRSILKRLRIAQDLGKDWRLVLRQYLLKYHSTNHSVTGKSPAEIMFGRKIRNKLPSVPFTEVMDEEIRDRDKVHKEKQKEYIDKKRSAKESEIAVGDCVVLKRMKKTHKLQSDYSPEEFQVVRKVGGDATVRSYDSGKEYRRNVAHLKKIQQSNITSTGKDDEKEHEASRLNDSEPELGQFETNRQNTEIGREKVCEAEKAEEQINSKRVRTEPKRYKDYISH